MTHAVPKPLPREHGAWGLLLQPFFAGAILARTIIFGISRGEHRLPLEGAVILNATEVVWVLEGLDAPEDLRHILRVPDRNGKELVTILVNEGVLRVNRKLDRGAADVKPGQVTQDLILAALANLLHPQVLRRLVL